MAPYVLKADGSGSSIAVSGGSQTGTGRVSKPPGPDSYEHASDASQVMLAKKWEAGKVDPTVRSAR